MGLKLGFRSARSHGRKEIGVSNDVETLRKEVDELKGRLADLPTADQSYLSTQKTFVEVLATESDDVCVVAILRFPHENKFNGVKVVAYWNNVWNTLDKSNIDPHFNENNGPIARFEPSRFGLATCCLAFNVSVEGANRLYEVLQKARQ